MIPPKSRERSVELQDVMLRDGLQNEDRVLPTARKIELVERLAASGLRRIEVSSFVSPRAMSQLADADAVFKGMARRPGGIHAALVPNLRGMERAIDGGADEANLVMSASQSHNRANLRMSREASLRAIREAAALATTAGMRVAAILTWCRRLQDDADIHSISLCDTSGMAYPALVKEVVGSVRDVCRGNTLALHFHNTQGLGLANVFAELESGVVRYDGALAGIGGCPYAPGATGNICTAELVHALEVSGYPTGVDLDALINTARDLEKPLGPATPGQVMKAGRRLSGPIAANHGPAG